MSRSNIHHVSTKHRRRYDPGVHGGRGVRQVVQAEKAHADAVVQQKRSDLPKGWHFVSHVPRGRHEKIAHHRGTRQGAANKEKSKCPCIRTQLADNDPRRTII